MPASQSPRYSRLTFLIAGVAINLLVAKPVLSQSPPAPVHREPAVANEPINRFASNQTRFACVVRPQRLAEHRYFGTLPFGYIVPEAYSFQRLDRVGITKLGLFCGPVAQTPSSDNRPTIEWSLAAQLVDNVDTETFLERWNARPTPQPPILPLIKPASLGEHSFFSVPAGTFFSEPRKLGKLRFTDRDGQPTEQGVNVGHLYPTRGYLEGGTQATGVVTFSQVSETSLIDNALPLAFFVDVFRVLETERETADVLMVIRNPDTGLESEPRELPLRSLLRHRLDLSRIVPVTIDNQPQSADLLDDFVSNGQLEIVLSVASSGFYLGLGPEDVYLRDGAQEFLTLRDGELLVAQSPDRLVEMLQARGPSTVAKRLSNLQGDAFIYAAAANDDEQQQLIEIVKMFGDSLPLQTWSGSLIRLTGELDVDAPENFRLSAEFTESRHASAAADSVRRRLRQTNEVVVSNLSDALKRNDVMANLLGFVLDGISLSLPPNCLPSIQEREQQLLAIVDDLLESIDVEVDGRYLSTRIVLEPAFFDKLAASELALASIEETLAHDFFARKLYTHGDEMFERVTRRIPEFPQVWFRRTHQLAYNNAVEFDSSEDQYQWIRRGINAMLDGVQANPDSLDFVWLLGNVIGRKIGDADRHSAYRELFAADVELHQRLGKLIDLNLAQSPDQTVDHWQVAKLLFEKCDVAKDDSTNSGLVPRYLLMSRPAFAQARYAQELSEQGHSEAAALAWQDAEQLFHELSNRPIANSGEDWLKLKQIETLRQSAAPDDPRLEQLEEISRSISYPYWLSRCQLEQTEAIREIRRLTLQGDKLSNDSQFETSLECYERALRRLLDFQDNDSESTEMILGEMKPLALGYRRCLAVQNQTEADSLTLLVDRIERSEEWSRSLMPWSPDSAGIPGLFER